MWEFDSLCLPPKRSFTADDVRRIRADAHVSQTVFAALLGVGKTTRALGFDEPIGNSGSHNCPSPCQTTSPFTKARWQQFW
jgi:hypothetical protein